MDYPVPATNCPRGGAIQLGFKILRKMTPKCTKYVLGAAVAAYGIYRVTEHIRMKKLRAKWAAAGKDVVVFHTIPKSNYTPCLTPFATKLETFFRMMDIKYVVDYEVPMGPKNKVPWITFNGEDYSDSELIVQMLQVKLNKFPDADVPKEDRALGLAMRVMVEEHIYWGVVSWRYVEDNLKGLQKVHDFSPFMIFVFKRFKPRLEKALYLQGLGRHSFEEIHGIVKRDFEALSVFLGNKPFFLGSSPQVVDCSIFAALLQIIYNSPGCPYLTYLKEDCPNLLDYTERMKQRFWPDWKNCIKKPNFTL